MSKFILAVIFAVLLVGCTNSNDAIRALTNAGYTDIKTGGYAWFACGQDDFYATKFKATNQTGKQVSGVVCSGLIMKNATIRF